MALPGFQFRSISLPSRLHPIKSWQISSSYPGPETTTTPVTLQTIESGLQCLSELHTLLQESYEFRHFPGNAKSLEDSLEASTNLLDSCSTIKDSVDMIRENIQSLQSALRRKGCNNSSSIQDDVSLHLRLRKRLQKTLSKTLKKLKSSESRNVPRLENGDKQREFLCLLKVQTGQHAILILKSVVMFLLDSVRQPIFEQGKWWRVSREKPVRVFDVQKELERLDKDMEGVEEGLERLFRLLVRIRVSVLNFIADV